MTSPPLPPLPPALHTTKQDLMTRFPTTTLIALVSNNRRTSPCSVPTSTLLSSICSAYHLHDASESVGSSGSLCSPNHRSLRGHACAIGPQTDGPGIGVQNGMVMVVIMTGRTRFCSASSWRSSLYRNQYTFSVVSGTDSASTE